MDTPRAGLLISTRFRPDLVTWLPIAQIKRRTQCKKFTNRMCLLVETVGFVVPKLRLHAEENRFPSEMVCAEHRPNSAPP